MKSLDFFSDPMVDILFFWSYTIRTIRATKEGIKNIERIKSSANAGNVIRKVDTGVQYTPGACNSVQVNIKKREPFLRGRLPSPAGSYM